jgi:hypothetical protein
MFLIVSIKNLFLFPLKIIKITNVLLHKKIEIKIYYSIIGLLILLMTMEIVIKDCVEVDNIVWPKKNVAIKLYLYYSNNVLPKIWPKNNIIFLEMYFRPDFDLLPKTIGTLSIVTQREVLKHELPSNIKFLWLTAPNAITTKFNIKKDNFDLYYISINNFQKYNVFIGGYFNDDIDNIKYYKLWYDYTVSGDPPLYEMKYGEDESDYGNNSGVNFDESKYKLRSR